MSSVFVSEGTSLMRGTASYRRPRVSPRWAPITNRCQPGRRCANMCLIACPKGERRILEFLIGHYPNAVERQEIDAATSYQRSSRDAYLQRLGARELVETRGRDVKASDDLFD